MLIVDGVSVTESAVINDYLDEVYSPQLHPGDPLDRARNRAWIAYASDLNGLIFDLMTAQTDEQFDRKGALLVKRLAWPLGAGTFKPYFNGSACSLVDVTYAPIMTRLEFIKARRVLEGLDEIKHLRAWSASLLSLDEVEQSVPDNFEPLLERFLHDRGSLLVAD